MQRHAHLLAAGYGLSWRAATLREHTISRVQGHTDIKRSKMLISSATAPQKFFWWIPMKLPRARGQ